MRFPWLTCLWAMPFLSGLTVYATGGLKEIWGRRIAVGAALAVLAYALGLWFPYQAQSGLWRLAESGCRSGFGMRYSLAVDGLSLLLCWLNAFLVFLALLSSWKQPFPPGYWASFLFLEAAVMGVFLTRDLFYFYVFWEVGLIPMFFIIGAWGTGRRIQAAIKFLLYTVSGSLAMLVGFLALVTLHHRATGIWSWEMQDLAHASLPPAAAGWVFVAIALGFAVKVPLFPLHSWLPDAHTEAPAAGSVLLAGIILKLGAYGFIRILIPVFPGLSREWAGWIGGLGALNILYGSLCAMAQSDLKRLVAFTSISHLGLCMLGLFSFTAQGIAGGSLQLINHGLSTGALFLMVGMLYERTHRRGVEEFGALARRAPQFSFFFGAALLSSIGLPGLNGFVGEAMALAGMAAARPLLAAAGLGGAVLSAAYFLPAYHKVFWSQPGPASVSEQVTTLDLRERGILWAVLGLILWIGLYPGPWLRILEPSVEALVK